MKTILSIIPYGLTIHDFFELRTPIRNFPNQHFFKSLAEWCVRGGTGKVDYTENYHQFTGLMDHPDDKIFHIFDIDPVDVILEEEISNVGFEGLFDGYDWRPLFEKIPINEPQHKSLRIPFNVHVVVDLDYHGEGEDFELFVEVLGFLDGQMNLSRI